MAGREGGREEGEEAAEEEEGAEKEEGAEEEATEDDGFVLVVTLVVPLDVTSAISVTGLSVTKDMGKMPILAGSFCLEPRAHSSLTYSNISTISPGDAGRGKCYLFIFFFF